MTNPVIAVIPDLHDDDHPAALWQAEAQWIADNAVANNIIAAIGIGDAVTTIGAAAVARAKAGFDLISLPKLIVPGNHDYDDIPLRTLTTYAASFPLPSGQSWYGGSYDGTPSNYYIKVSAGGHTYLLLGLELYPRTVVLSWANSVMRANRDCEVIIATHGFLDLDGSQIQHADPHGPDTYGLNADNDATEMWAASKDNPNLMAIICGHQTQRPLVPPPVTSATRTDLTGYGKALPQIFINHQDEGWNAGKDYLGLLVLSPATSVISMTSYSPYLAAFDATGAYTLPLHIDRAKMSGTRN